MLWKRALILILAVTPAAFADDVAANLVGNAWYWQARARSDKAEDAWKKVLEAAPDQPDALAALGGFAARAGRSEEARSYLARLVAKNPNHPDAPVLKREIQLGTRYGSLLSQARKLVHEGHAAEGAAKYRELFGEAGPPGDLALEYYQTVAGAPGGFQEARDGLRKLTRRAPAEARYRLSLGKVLSYREESRREGIQILSAVARDPAVGHEAQAAWRQALLWLSPNDRDLPLLRAWLKLHPDDTEVARHIDSARHAGTVKEGFTALDKGDLRTAEQLFRAAGNDPDARRGLSLLAARRAAETKKAGFAAVQRGDLARGEQLFKNAGDDPDTRLGLALVAQKEGVQAMAKQDFDGARTFLERAKQLAPARRDLWEEPLRSATFWQAMRAAQAARKAGQDGQAETLLTNALGDAPAQERWQAELALADLRRSRKDDDQAERGYRSVLASHPQQPDALRGLLGLLVEEKRFDDAVPVNDTLARIDAAKALSPGWLRAQILRDSASRMTAAHDFEKARAQLEEAHRLAPSDVWVLHDLANVLLRVGAVAEARPVVAALLHEGAGLPEAQATHARLLVAEGRDAEALQVLDAVDSRDPSVLALRRRLAVQVRIPALLQLAQSGRRAEAEGELEALERQSMGEPDLVVRLALAWSKLGDRDRAVSLMQAAIARAPSAARGGRLELAGALLQAGEEAQAERLLDGMDADPKLTAEERRSLGELRLAMAIHKADRQRAQGDVGSALATLQPMEQRFPHDPRLLAALARTVEPSDPHRAHGLYLEVLRARPGDLDSLRGAADTTSDRDEAQKLAAEAVRLHPDDARAWELSGRAAERAGDDGAAMRAYERGSRIAEAQAAYSEAQPGQSSAAPSEGAQRLAAFIPDPITQQIARDMQRVHDRHRASLGGGFEFRQRSGEPGLSQLDERRETIEATAPLGYSAKGMLRVSEVQLMPGGVATGAAPRYGTGGSNPFDPGVTSGAELQATYDSKNFVATLGTTPLGFPVFSVLGGVTVRGSIGPLSLSAGGSRRTIEDSLLSYAGATDPQTGQHFGGVVHDSGRLDAGLNLGDVSLFAYGEFGRIIGLRVADNTRASAGGGFEVVVYDGAAGRIALAPDGAFLAFDRNLRFFTLGHGGYFSPQRFLHGGVALRYRHDGTVRWDASAEPGYDFYQEAHEEMFPLTPNGTLYPGQNSAGLSFNGRAFVGIGLSHEFELGITAAVQQAPEFQEIRAGVSLRFIAP
ncbi:MAG TPA: cellulose synthase subunit BcsC-related outer membrane protein [Myxococcales bacterium]